MKKRYSIALLALLGSNVALAQTVTLKEVIVANGGRFEFAQPYTDSVTVGSYNPVNNAYTLFGKIPDESVQNVLIKGDTAVVLTASRVTLYNLTTKTQIAQIGGISNLRRGMLHNNGVLITRSGTTTADPRFGYVSFDSNTLTDINGITDDAEYLTATADKIYVAVPGAYPNTIGKVAVYNKATLAYIQTIDFGVNGSGLGKLFSNGNKVYAIISLGYQSPAGKIISIDNNNFQYGVESLNSPVDQGTTIYQNILYARFGAQGIGSFNLATNQLVSPVIVNQDVAASALDTVNGVFYLTRTDYFSFGKLKRFTINGTKMDSVDVGISPEALALVYDVQTAVKPTLAKGNISIYPNPANSFVTVTGMEAASYRLVSSNGAVVKQGVVNGAISLEGLAAGLYNLVLTNGNKAYVHKLVKE